MLTSVAKTVPLVLGLLLAGTTLHSSTGSDRAPRPDPGSDLRALLWPSTGTPDRLDHRGRRLNPAALADKVVVVAFVSADCTITCAVRTMALDTLARALPPALGERVLVLGVDTDPARDDAARLRGFADGLVGETTPLRLLVSDAAGTAALAAKLRYPASALPEPPPIVLLFDRRGRIAMTYGGDRLDGPRLSRDIAALETFAQGLDRPADGAAATPF